jgi:hypothetical protein
MTKSLTIGVLSVLSVPVFSIPVNAQAVYDYTQGALGKSVLDAEQRRIYGNDKCYGLLSSAWKYYGSSPPATAIRSQRKYETRYGCPHLYEVDGTVNRVRGINDSGINPTSRSSPNSTSQLTRSQVKGSIDAASMLLGTERVREAVCERNVFPKVYGRALSLEERSLFRQELRC